MLNEISGKLANDKLSKEDFIDFIKKLESKMLKEAIWEKEFFYTKDFIFYYNRRSNMIKYYNKKKKMFVNNETIHDFCIKHLN